MHRLLYFPLASPPDTVALQAALYWEELATIRPSWYEFSSPLLRTLEDEGLLNAVNIDETLGFHQVDTIVTEIRELFASVPGALLEPDPRLKPSAGTRLYVGKLPMVIESELEQLGAAVQVDDRVMMAGPAALSIALTVATRHVARALNETDSTGVTAIYTDRRHLLAQAITGLPGSSYSAWQMQLGRWLPVPSPKTDPRELLRFRAKYEDERRRLATAITGIASSVTVGGVVEVPALISELKMAYADLEAAGAAQKIHWLKKGMTVVTGAAVTGVATALGGDVASTVVGFLAAAGIDAVPTNTRGRDSSFAYLSEVQKTFTARSDTDSVLPRGQ